MSSPATPSSQPPVVKASVVQPVPAPGNPAPEDKFTFAWHCDKTHRDITICYQTFGSPSDPCLLLVCGLGTTMYNYHESFCNKLVARGFYVVRYDNRDVGLSTHLDGFPTTFLPRMVLPQWLSVGEGEPPYTLRCMALDGLNLLTRLGIDRAHIYGGSMGGMCVQTMAILQPERVLSLTIVYSHSGGPNVKTQSLAMSLSFLDKPKSQSREHLVEFKVRNAKLYTGGYDLDEEEASRRTNFVLDRSPDDRNGVLRQVWAVQRAPSRDEDLKKLTGFPTLIIHGPQDTMVPFENGMQLSQLIEGSRLVSFPRLGHYVPPDLYDSFADEISLLRGKSEHPGQHSPAPRDTVHPV